MQRGRNQSGFTLIELVVAVAIVAILAAIAIPNYVEYVQRGRRVAARAALLEAAQWQERFRTENNAYSCTLPTGLTNVPPNGTINYVLSVTATGTGTCATPQVFTLLATRQGGSPVASDECLDFTLSSLGERGLSKGGTPSKDTALIQRCWDR